MLPDQAAGRGFVSDTRGEIERLRRSDPALFERGDTARSALSGEEFRRDLWEAMQDQSLAERIKNLFWGSGSGMIAGSGGAGPNSTAYVFCARIGNLDRPEFRLVELPADAGAAAGGPAGSTSDLLTCLDRAQPPAGGAQPRSLSARDYDRAFDAWRIARDDIVRSRRAAAGPATYQQPLAKALRDSAHLARSHPPPELTREEVERIIESIEAPHPHRTVSEFRSALRGSEIPAEQAAAAAGVVRELGLQPYEPPEPLPPVAESDINLICWLAVSPQ